MVDHRLDRIGEDGPMTIKHMKALERIAELEAENDNMASTIRSYEKAVAGFMAQIDRAHGDMECAAEECALCSGEAAKWYANTSLMSAKEPAEPGDGSDA